MANTVEPALQKAILAVVGPKVRLQSSDSEERFTKRVVEYLADEDNFDDASYKKLPKPVQAWCNEAAGAIAEDREIPLLLSVESEEPEAEAEAEAEASAEDAGEDQQESTEDADSAPPEENEVAEVQTESNGKKPAKRKTAKAAPAKKPAKVVAARGGTRKAKGKNGVAHKRGDGPRPGSKLEIIGGLLARAKGCTRADVLAATDWPAVSMQQQATALGVKLRTEKEGRGMRYWAAK